MDNNFKDKIDIYNYKNNVLIYNDKFDFREIDLYEFFEYVFVRNDECLFELKGKENYVEGRYNNICVEINAYTKIVKDPKTNEDVEKFFSKNYIITNEFTELDELIGKEFVISSPISYIGRNRNSKNARLCYGLAFDIDGVGKNQILDIIHQMTTKRLPVANIIVNSGNGVHLYYLFEKPISLFDNVKVLLKELKYNLTFELWNSFTSSIKERQVQGIFQGFRLPGTKTKFNTEVKAFYNYDSKYFKVAELNKFIYDEKKRLSEDQIHTIENSIYKRKKLSLKEAKEKYPDWYERRIIKGEKAGRWYIKRDLYDWWLSKCKSSEIKEGHRYFALMTLSMYAIKCNISYEELRKDAYNLLDAMEELTVNEDNHFTEDDIEDSLKAYLDNYITFPRKDIEKLTGVLIPANKRNGRKREIHIKTVNATRKFRKEIGEEEYKNNGRPSKLEVVKKWKLENQNGTKYQCQKDTGLSKNTIKKWW